MDDIINVDSDIAGKSDKKMCISQKSVKFSIDSLLAVTNKEETKSDESVNGNLHYLNVKMCSQNEDSNLDSGCSISQKEFPELALTEQFSKKENEVVSTTDGFYQRTLSEGKYKGYQKSRLDVFFL